MEHVLAICEVDRVAIGVNKSNHSIQNLLLFVTEPRTLDNILVISMGGH
jgi:hypothetical protein